MYRVKHTTLFNENGGNTEHIYHRNNRINIANELIRKEHGELIDTFVVDNNHPNGNEYHNVYSNGIIKIFNVRTHKLITILIARPQQIKRYYELCGMRWDKAVINKCFEHQKLCLNYIN